MKTDFIKKFIADYILVQAETTLSIAIVGSLFVRDIRVPFWCFCFPAILGIFYMLPCIPLYLKEDLSVKWVIVVRILELVTIEVGTLWAVRLILQDKLTSGIAIAVCISTVIFDFLTYLISDMLERKEARLLTEKLREMRR